MACAFATAIYTGLSKGELLGLRKTDLDFPNRLVLVCRSYDREPNKGGREEAVPMAAELIPFCVKRRRSLTRTWFSRSRTGP